MKSVVMKGKDVDNAIENGLQQMKWNMENVTVEVIQQESRGVMGIGRKDAIVKLTSFIDHRLRPTPSSSMDEWIEQWATKQDHSHSLEGKAWVENGEIHVKDSPTQYATVNLSHGISLYKNGTLVTDDATIVTEDDSLVVDERPVQKETEWKVTLDEGKRTAFLHIRPGYESKRKLKDVKAGHSITLRMIEVKKPTNTLRYEDVLDELHRQNVSVGFQEKEWVKALEELEEGTYEIAKAIEPIPGRDGWLERLVDIDQQSRLSEKKGKTVDFREMNKIPTVESAQIVARIHPPVEGVDGTTVTGEIIPFSTTVPLDVRVGDGFTVIDQQLVSTKPGRPKITVKRQLVKASIVPKLTKRGNVNIGSGNIRFSGDIEVIGSVEENMVVEAGGSLFIHHSVDASQLKADTSMVVQGSVIGAQLSVGHKNTITAELHHSLSIIQPRLEEMITVLQQLTKAPEYKAYEDTQGGIQPLVRILLEKKFNDLIPLIKKYVKTVNCERMHLEDDTWSRLAVYFSNVFLTLTYPIRKIEFLIYLVDEVKHLCEEQESSKDQILPFVFRTV